jgi:hypothetical protein
VEYFLDILSESVLSVAISVKTMLRIPKESSWMAGLEDEIFAAVNMLVVPEFSQGFKHFGVCCNAGLDLDISAPIFNLQQNASIQNSLLDPVFHVC